MQLATPFMMYKHEDLKAVMITTLEVKEQFDCYSLPELHTCTTNICSGSTGTIPH